MSEYPTESKSLIEHVRSIPDHRVTGRCHHLLVDIIVVAIISILSGADDWNSIENFAKPKEEFRMSHSAFVPPK